MFPSVEVLGVSFAHLRMEDVTEMINNHINEQKKLFLVTANPEIVMYARKDPEYKQVISNADLVIADGIGVVIGSKILNNPLPERIAGFDVTVEMLHRANQNKWKIFMLGAKDDILTKAIENIKVDYPDLIIAGSHHGYFDDQNPDIPKMVKEAQADLVFVALGFPRQEKWIANNLTSFHKGVFIGVGGSFDVLAGEVERAPEIWQKVNLEWLYRLVRQPSRWRRALVLPKFMVEVLKEKLTN